MNQVISNYFIYFGSLIVLRKTRLKSVYNPHNDFETNFQ
jgi:hypothetical protein